MVNRPLTILVANCSMQPPGTAPRQGAQANMTMATRSGPASGDLSPRRNQGICGLRCGDAAIFAMRSISGSSVTMRSHAGRATWSKKPQSASRLASIGGLGDIRTHIPEDSGLDALEGFMAPLVAVSAFDLGQDRLPTFTAYRFLYERLLRRACASRGCPALSAPRHHYRTCTPTSANSAPVDQRSRRARLVGARTELLSRMDRKDRRNETGQLNGRLYSLITDCGCRCAAG